ncbi:hypothetical protein BC567DRAFT_530 [Phyllosticta citribraziliensis]
MPSDFARTHYPSLFVQEFCSYFGSGGILVDNETGFQVQRRGNATRVSSAGISSVKIVMKSNWRRRGFLVRYASTRDGFAAWCASNVLWFLAVSNQREIRRHLDSRLAHGGLSAKIDGKWLLRRVKTGSRTRPPKIDFQLSSRQNPTRPINKARSAMTVPDGASSHRECEGANQNDFP